MIKKTIKRNLISSVVVYILLSVIICVLYLIDKNKRLAELESNSKLVETSVGTIEYKMIGSKGPVILFTHATPGGYDQGWSIEGYRVLAPSRPGYLRTPLEVGKTPAEQAQAFSALLESLNIAEVCVYGVSGGGPSAICFAALFPEKTSALILLMAVSQSINPNEKEVPSFLQSDFLTWAGIHIIQNDLVLKTMLKVIIPDPNAAQLIIEDQKKIESFKSLMWCAWPISKRRPGNLNDTIQYKSLALPSYKVKVPTLIIHGSEDETVPVSQSKILSEQIPGSKLVIIEGVGHMGISSKIEEVEKNVNELLDVVNTNKSTEKTLPATLP